MKRLKEVRMVTDIKIGFTPEELAMILDVLFIVDEFNPTDVELATKKSIEDKIYEWGYVEDGQFIIR